MTSPSKAQLRKHYKALRDNCPVADRLYWSDQIADHLSAFCAQEGIANVGLFEPFGSEVDLHPFEFSNPHLSFFFPRIMSPDPPRLAWGPRPLEPGVWGLQEPACAPHTIPPVQLLLVPGLAFAADGYRLGYGKGYYDSTLAALKDSVLTLGVGFECQRCRDLPTGEWDLPVEGIATEAGITWIAAIEPS